MRKQWNLEHFFYTIIGAFFLVIFLLVMIVLIVTSQKTITDFTISMRLEMLEKNRQQLEYQLKQVEDIGLFILTDTTLTRMLINDADKSYDSLEMIRELDAVLDNYLYIKPDVESINIYNDELTGYPVSDKHIKPLKTVSWIERHVEIAESEAFWVVNNQELNQVKESEGGNSISYLMKMRDFHSKLIGYIEIVVSKNIISGYLDTSMNELNESSALILLNAQNQIMFNIADDSYMPVIPVSMQTYLELPFEEGYEYQSEGKYLQIYTAAVNERWRLVELVESDVIGKRVKEIINGMILSGFILLFLIFPLVAWISRLIMQPINHLIEEFEKVEVGIFDDKHKYHFIKEFDQLFFSFSTMNNKLKKLISTLKDEQKNKRDAELRALQSQINPHFLYNTLDMIFWMASAKGYTNISTLVVRLSRLYRICLNKGNALIRLSMEIEHARLYAQIQQERFKEKFRYIEDIDVDLNGCFVPKIIIQPFVENSIVHGFDGECESKPYIKIKTKKIDKKSFTIIIDDNGVGYDDEELGSQAASRIKSGSLLLSGYGIKNVNERIQLYFGPDYGATVKNKSGNECGVEVKITLPIIDNMDNFVAPDEVQQV